MEKLVVKLFPLVFIAPNKVFKPGKACMATIELIYAVFNAILPPALEPPIKIQFSSIEYSFFLETKNLSAA
jgi:hypothetical protein